MKTLLFVIGTRPEAIKLAPLVLRLNKNPKFKILVCSTGQHRELLKPFLNFFNITPDFDLDLMKHGQSLSELASRMIIGLQEIIDKNKIDSVVVQGDTTSSFVGGLVAFYNKLEVIHVEAGLRSNDINSPFPEEFNRRALSLFSSIHLAPTSETKENLIGENIPAENIFVTGNTGVDALLSVKEHLEKSPELAKKFDSQFAYLNPRKKLILVTLHRRESFEANIQMVMSSLVGIAERSDVEIFIPLHPNPDVRKNASCILGEKANWAGKAATVQNVIWLSEPLDYVSFVYLMSRAHFIVTDSGGIQEEAPSLGKPVLIARENTERPDALKSGVSRLAPLEKTAFMQAINELLDNTDVYGKMSHPVNPFGDGKACGRIEKILEDSLK